MIHPDLLLALAHSRIEGLRRHAGRPVRELGLTLPVSQDVPEPAENRHRPAPRCYAPRYRRARRFDLVHRVRREVVRSK